MQEITNKFQSPNASTISLCPSFKTSGMSPGMPQPVVISKTSNKGTPGATS